MTTRVNSIFGNSSRRTASSTAPAKNREGYPAWERSVEERYLQTLLTNTFGNTFYASQKDMIAEAKAVHAEMLAKDPAFAAKALPYARNKGFMRTQPVYGLAKLAEKPEAGFSFEEVFNQVIRTPKDLADFATIVKSERGGIGGRKIRRAVANWLRKNLSEYWVIKYGAEKNEGFSMKDIFRLYHPDFGARKNHLEPANGTKGKASWNVAPGERNQLVEYLFGREANLESLAKVAAFERLKKASTDEEKIAAIAAGQLPHEVVSTFAGKSTKIWEALVEQMPVFALLRNLATLERNGVLTNSTPLKSTVRQTILRKLTTAESIAKSKILPYRFLDAEAKVSVGWVKDAVREALELSFVNLPEIAGRTSVQLDISGSMSGQYLKVASIFALSLAKKMDDVRFTLFDDRVEDFHVSKRDSILTQAGKIRARGGTDTSLPMRQLLRERDKVDTIILITDEQQNTGKSMFDVFEEYRRHVNKKVKLFIVDVSPYKNASTPSDPNIHFIYGWSQEVLSYISLATQGWKSVADAVREGAV